MASTDKVVNSVNVMAVCINKMAKSNIAMMKSLEKISVAIDEKISACDTEVSVIHPINISRREQLIEKIDRASNKINGISPSKKEIADMDSEIESMVDMSDGIISIAELLQASINSSNEISNKLNTNIKQLHDQHKFLSDSNDRIRQSEEIMTESVSKVSALVELANKAILSANNLTFHVKQSNDKLQNLIDSSKVQLDTIGPLIDDLINNIKDIDSSTLYKTKAIKDDIVIAVDEVKKYMKPMADRVSGIERTIDNITCDHIDLPDVNPMSLRSRSRRK